MNAASDILRGLEDEEEERREEERKRGEAAGAGKEAASFATGESAARTAAAGAAADGQGGSRQEGDDVEEPHWATDALDLLGDARASVLAAVSGIHQALENELHLSTQHTRLHLQ